MGRLMRVFLCPGAIAAPANPRGGTWAPVVLFPAPGQVILPNARRRFDAQSEGEGGHPAWLNGWSEQAKIGRMRRFVALFQIAAYARGDNIGPLGFTPLQPRCH